MRSEEKKSFFDSNDKKNRSKDQKLLESDLQNYDREPHRREPEFRHKFTADKSDRDRSGRPEVTFKDVQPMRSPPQPRHVPIMRSIETQTNGQLITVTEPEPKTVIKQVMPKDLKTESKITVEVTKANKKERSQVISQVLLHLHETHLPEVFIPFFMYLRIILTMLVSFR